MKKIRKFQSKSLYYHFVITAIGILLISIIGCGGGDDGGDVGGDVGDDNNSPEVFISIGLFDDLELEIEGCSWSSSTSEFSDYQYNSIGNVTSFHWSVTLNDGNCSGETYSVYVYDLMYDPLGRLVGGKYDYDGGTYIIE